MRRASLSLSAKRSPTFLLDQQKILKYVTYQHDSSCCAKTSYIFSVHVQASEVIRWSRGEEGESSPCSCGDLALGSVKGVCNALNSFSLPLQKVHIDLCLQVLSCQSSRAGDLEPVSDAQKSLSIRRPLSFQRGCGISLQQTDQDVRLFSCLQLLQAHLCREG